MRVSDEELARTRGLSRYAYVYLSAVVPSNVASGELVNMHDILDDLRDARADVARLTAENARLREAVKAVKWPTSLSEGHMYCPWCDEMATIGLHDEAFHREWRGGPCPGGDA